VKEKEVEIYLRDQVKAVGGRAYKFVSPGNAGVPDRLILFPGGRTVFVELKAPGKKPTALQEAQQKKLKDLGFEVIYWIVNMGWTSSSISLGGDAK
jgi:hypothetical protein